MASQTEDAFWLVWNPEGGNPTAQHDSEHKAKAEAKRLAAANPGELFIVMQSVKGFQLATMKEIDFTDIPF